MYEINGHKFNLLVERKDNKYMYLRVDEDNLYVTCPDHVTYKDINAFIKEKEKWVIKTLETSRSSKTKFTDHIYLNGKKYKLVVLFGNNDVKVGNDVIYIWCKSNKISDVKTIFYEWSKKYLKQFVQIRELRYINILNDYGYRVGPVYNFKYLKSKWGCCYTKENLVHLSVRLIHFEDECKEAVLWHELLHFVIPNHSKRFHEVLKLHMPKYKEYIDKLY